MSRIGKQEIKIPQGVTVTITQGLVKVQGPKGILERIVVKPVTILQNDGIVTVDVPNKENKSERSLWGTYASHVKNMIIGVTGGYKKQLELNGVGYRVAMQGTDLKIDIGFSHPVIYKIPQGIVASVEKNAITIVGPDKELVGHTASEIRSIKKPEPYKGKGIRYVGEEVRRKAGKSAKSSD